MADISTKLIHVPKHKLDKMVGARLADTLREQYKRKTARVVRGDSVRVLRGEYKGVEGKVEKINVERGTLTVEGIRREKIRGGQVKVPIHSSNVSIIALNLEDKYRSSRIQGSKPGPAKKEARKAAAEKKNSSSSKEEERKE